MRRHTEGRATAIVLLLTLAGLAMIAVASYGAFETFDHAQYECGSVMNPKDPRDLGSTHAAVPPALVGAHDKCEARRENESEQARMFLVGGAILLVGALAAPTLARRIRRFRRHLRSRRS